MTDFNKDTLPADAKTVSAVKTHHNVIHYLATSFVAVFLCVFVLLCAFLARAYHAPLSLSYLKPYVEDALSTPNDGFLAHIGQFNLHWVDDEKTFLFQAQNLSLTNDNGQTVMAVQDVALNASIRHLLVGKFRPKLVLVYEPELAIRRLVDGSFDFGFKAVNAKHDDDYIEGDQTNSVLADILYVLGHEENPSQSSPLSALRRFDIRSARLRVYDEAENKSWGVPEIDVSLSNSKGRGVRVITDVYFDQDDQKLGAIHSKMILPKQSSELTARVMLDQLSSQVLFDRLPELSNYIQGGQGFFNGMLQIKLSKDFDLLSAKANIKSPSGELRLDVYDGQAMAYKDLSMDVSYDAKTGVNFNDLSVVFEGIQLSLLGGLKPDSAGYAGNVTLRVPFINQDHFKSLWPESLHYVGAYKWLSNRIRGSGFNDVIARAQFHVGDDGAFDLSDLTADFTFDDAHINYREPLPPVSHAKGRGHFDYVSELVQVRIESAKLGGLDVGPSEVELAHVIESKHGWADVYVRLNGALSSVFDILEKDPIKLSHDYNLADMGGKADLRVSLQMPTFGDPSIDDVTLDVRGKVIEGKLPAFLKGQDLSVINGDFKLSDNVINIDGKAQFVRQPLSFNYQTFMHSKDQDYIEKVHVNGNAGNDLRAVMGIDLSSFMDGSAKIDLNYTKYKNDREQISLTADLAPSHVFVHEFGFSKDVGQTGSASCQVEMKSGAVQSITALDVYADGLSLRGGILSFEGRDNRLSGGSANNLMLGQTLGAVSFKVDGQNVYRIEGDLSTFDLRDLLNMDSHKKKDPSEKLAFVASIEADEIFTHQDKSVSKGKLYVDMDNSGRFNQLEMDALAGKGAIYLRYKPNEKGVRTFRFEADDAGATLASFGLYKNIKGGAILIHAEPHIGEADHNLLGVAEITNFRVVGAPTLAKIMSLASLEGLTDGLANEGIEFDRLETQFDWAYRSEGSLLVMENGRTSGAALGLTFDGLVDQAANKIDVSGAIIPVSQLNDLIGSIPVIGQVLTGGSGVFAATYKLEGPVGEPEISINPLSVLAPGIIRRVLFE